MSPESRTCQNCHNGFVVEADDFSFYEKMKVPPPTFCPECRMIRRLIWRNHRSLFKRECGLCKKTLISMYKDDGTLVYCIDCYNGDQWDQFAYASDIDWTTPFFLQINKLIKRQPRIYQYRLGTVINSDYGNSVVNSKNAYLSFSVIDCEDIMYCEGVDRSRNTLDSFCSFDLDQCSENIISSKNYNCHYMVASHSCIDSYFLYDCVNCQDCCLSSNLRNQQYVFRNKKLSKEEYQKAVSKLSLDTFSGLQEAQNQFESVYQDAIHKYADIISSQNVSGDFISNSKNIFTSFDVSSGCEDIKNSFRIISSKDVMDTNYTLAGELIYESTSASNNAYKQICGIYCFASKNIEYSLFCKNCSDCFGCVGLKNAQYCILNKQYSKEEYDEIVIQLRKYMIENPYIDKNNKIYTYGEFYPHEFSPFHYNETVVLDYYPRNKTSAIEAGYFWKDKENKQYVITKPNSDLPDSTSDVSAEICNDTIDCRNNGDERFQCTTAFKITPNEFQFYLQKKLPLPRFCSNCRHYLRLKYKNPMRLYQRECNNGCGNVFQTTYAPNGPQRVYCEQCYQAEVL